MPLSDRTAKLSRETGETQVSVELNVDGTGGYEIKTGHGIFHHLLPQLSRHGLIDLGGSAQRATEGGLPPGVAQCIPECASLMQGPTPRAPTSARLTIRLASDACFTNVSIPA